VFISLNIVLEALTFRYLLAVFLSEKFKAPILNEFLLSVAAGSFASLVIVYFNKRKIGKTTVSTQQYVTWEFTDSEKEDSIRMSFSVEYDRTNLSNDRIQGLRGGGFELCLWSKGAEIKEGSSPSLRPTLSLSTPG
jgi:hypothetical protein